MKLFSRLGLVAALSLSVMACPPVVERSEAAAALVTNFNGPSPQSVKMIGFGDVTAAQTFATTAYADVAGSNVTYVPTLNDCTTAARKAACLIEVSWSFDATKATATTGVCAVYVNGAVVASSARTVGAVTEDVIGGTFVFANSTVGSQTLKLQCKSGDTNVFTVNFGHVVYKEIIPPAAS